MSVLSETESLSLSVGISMSASSFGSSGPMKENIDEYNIDRNIHKNDVRLPPDVCRRAHILFTLFVFVCE